MTTLQTLFTNKKRGFSCEVTIPPDFQAEFDALSPRMAYCAAYGFGQSTIDGIAGMKDQAAFEAKILKKSDAIFAGTVRVAGSGERTPTKTPMEREVWRIAAGELAEIFTKKKVPKDRQATYIKMLVTRDWERLEGEARVNLEATASLSETTFDLLDDLFSAMDENDEEDEDEAEAAE